MEKINKIIGQTTNNYGHGDIIRLISGYPKLLPLNAVIQHGWYGKTISDFKKNPSLFLVWSQRIKKMSEENGLKAYVVGAPLVRFRHLYGINKMSNAKGTIVFPQHSVKNRKQVLSISDYCSQLTSLPTKYHPFTICLHYRDLDEWEPQFSKNGFNVVSAGHSRKNKFGFAKSFYSILSNFRFATSNDIGSYTFYSIEMGIPFFLYGSTGEVIWRANGENYYQDNKDTEFRDQIKHLFQYPIDTISEEQRKFVIDELGLNDSLSGKKLLILFYKHLFKEFFLYPVRISKEMHLLWREICGKRNK